MPNPDDICTTCHGKFSEHEGRIHPFTSGVAELSTPREREEAAAKQRQQQVRVQLPQINGTDGAAIGRLLDLLMDKGVLTERETLYVLGVGMKPEPLNDASGYQDPFPSSRGGI
jgi:hypothetical protein